MPRCRGSSTYCGTGTPKKALERLATLLIDLSGMPSAPAEKLAVGVAEFETYIRNNQESIPNYGERYRQGGNDQHGVRRIDD